MQYDLRIMFYTSMFTTLIEHMSRLINHIRIVFIIGLLKRLSKHHYLTDEK